MSTLPPAVPIAPGVPRGGGRLVSLDQFRGYTVAAMLLANYGGGFAVLPSVLKHHNSYCSYADTIMPQFLFAVGFALRLVMLRNVASFGRVAATGRALRRIGLLAVLGFVFYQVDLEEPFRGGGWSSWWTPVTAETLWRNTFQTLVHIAVTSLWVLPVITASGRVRLGFGLVSAVLYAAVSMAFWYTLLHEKRVIEGGPLGFLAWTIPALVGSWAYDLRQGLGARGALRPLIGWGVGLMGLGYVISCLGAGGPVAAAPFSPPAGPLDMWTMSQRAGSVSYVTFAAGFAMVVYGGFVWWCDVRGGGWRWFGVLGANALAAYLLHEVVMVPFSLIGNKGDPWWLVVVLIGGYMATTTALVWYCNRRGWYLRL
jgi:predicted acyltransferase